MRSAFPNLTLMNLNPSFWSNQTIQITLVMENKEKKFDAYMRPETEVLEIKTESFMDFESGGDGGEIFPNT